MSKPPRPHGGLFFTEGQCYPMTIQQVLARYDNLIGIKLKIVSNEEGIEYQTGESTMAVPHTSEVFEHLQRQLSYPMVHAWYQRNPGKSLQQTMDTQGDLLIDQFGRNEFQSMRQRAVTHDEQHLAHLASLPTVLPPKPPKLRILNGGKKRKEAPIA